MTTPAILITQCLQNDFVKAIERYDAKPNALHVGYEESLRLLGEDPNQGPVARTMQWAYQVADEKLRLIHIRDWHDEHDERQASHLRQFGSHCLADSVGADFAFAEPQGHVKNTTVINSLTLNDFFSTSLADELNSLVRDNTAIGLIGVWTEAKISYLAYELSTRYPQAQIAICSPLTAGSSRSQHFFALQQMKQLLGVHIIESIGAFMAFLVGDHAHNLPANQSSLTLRCDQDLGEEDELLLQHLYRDCQSVDLKALSGGFSGNLILACESRDQYGQQQAPTVVKIGAQTLIARERMAFEQVESVLGNSAPRIADFMDYGERGGLKYRYASMRGQISKTLQSHYQEGLALEKIFHFLDVVFKEQLGAFYQAAKREKLDLLSYYQFDPARAHRILNTVNQILDQDCANLAEIEIVPGITCPNIASFYEHDLSHLQYHQSLVYVSFIHGDLNGANIIVDEQENVWLIDFFHTHRGHVLKDLIKLENDLLYIFSQINSQAELIEALRISEILFSIQDLAAALPPINFSFENLQRCYDTLRRLRSYYADIIHSHRDPLQLIIGQLRYSVHSLSFDECNAWQKRWALYNSGHLAVRLKQALEREGALRVDWVDSDFTRQQLGLTILPGRRDHGREVEKDIDELRRLGVNKVLVLLTLDELKRYGVEKLFDCYDEAKIDYYFLPILDQKNCTLREMEKMITWIESTLTEGQKLVIHCVGGLGRSGTVASCYLISKGLSPQDAMEMVRQSRSPRAIESHEQEQFVFHYPAYLEAKSHE